MDDVYAFVSRSMQLDVLLSSLGVMCVALGVIWCSRLSHKRKWTFVAIFATYLFLVLWTTLIRRSSTAYFDYHLLPYWNLEDILSGEDPRDIVEILLNIMLFIPIGLLLSEIFSHVPVRGIVFIGFSLSVMIELSQFFLSCGLSDINDVIHNTLGCLLGAWVMNSFVKER